MIYSMKSAPAIGTLLDGVGELVDVRVAHLGDCTARLEFGKHPVLYLDCDADDEDKSWAVLDALRALILGPEQATSAHWVRRLHLVTMDT